MSAAKSPGGAAAPAPGAQLSAASASTLQTASFSTRFAAVTSLHKLMRALASSSASKAPTRAAPEVAYRTGLLLSGASTGARASVTDKAQFESLAGTLLPLLFGSWLECAPSDPAAQTQHQKASPSSPVTHESIAPNAHLHNANHAHTDTSTCR